MTPVLFSIIMQQKILSRHSKHKCTTLFQVPDPALVSNFVDELTITADIANFRKREAKIAAIALRYIFFDTFAKISKLKS